MVGLLLVILSYLHTPVVLSSCRPVTLLSLFYLFLLILLILSHSTDFMTLSLTLRILQNLLEPLEPIPARCQAVDANDLHTRY